LSPPLLTSAHGRVKEYFENISAVEFIAKAYDSREMTAKIQDLLGKTGNSL